MTINMTKLQRAYLRGFMKAATDNTSHMPPIGAPNPQIGGNTGGQPMPMSGQAQPPQIPGSGLAPMQKPGPSGNPGMQQFIQMLQQLKQQNPANRPAPAPVLNQYLK